MSPDPVPLPPGRYLLDNSAWQRAKHPLVATVLKQGSDEDRLCVAGPLVAEALYSARNADEIRDLREGLTRGFVYLDADEQTWQLAFDAMETMATYAPQFHRRPLPDYLIAALAHQHAVWVLHYDADYEKLQHHSGLTFSQHWVAPRGSLERPPH